ncbi:MAG: response regulator [Petrimonas sp.]|jgi:DNA-binding NarL/FixJ family response regulator
MKIEIKVAIYEDNDALRESLSFLVKGLELLHFTGAYPNCHNILENCESDMPDVILMDFEMSYLSGIDATRLVKDKYPDINMMMLTVLEDRDKIFNSLRAGATGYLLKKASTIQIVEANSELAKNRGSPISSEIARKFLRK